MIRLQVHPMKSREELQVGLQKAVELEFAILPPYLYALFTLRDGTNEAARSRISAIVREEMTHLALACNVLNAIGGRPVLADASVAAPYPRTLPWAIGSDDGEPFLVSLLPFSEEAMDQAMQIEEPEDPIEFPVRTVREAELSFQTIGQFYRALDEGLRGLSASEWVDSPSRQLTDHPFFAGELFRVRGYGDASRAIDRIVSEGEGTRRSPLDFEGEVAHYYRFEEIRRDRVLRKDTSAPQGFSWGSRLGVHRHEVIPAIANPGKYDFSRDPAAQEAQKECDRAFTVMLEELERAVNGELGRLGNAVLAMFELRRAARAALKVRLKDSDKFAGPAFCFRPELARKA